MIHFDVADLSERRSEEVISFFWRSVYVMLTLLYFQLYNWYHTVT